MWAPKDSVEGKRVLHRRVLPNEALSCNRGQCNTRSIPGQTEVVELWLKIDSSSPFSAGTMWCKASSVCRECYDRTDQGVTVEDLDHNINFFTEAVLYLHRCNGNCKIRPPLPKPTTSDKIIILDCPRELKEYAKPHGARFHPTSKQWYVPPGCDLAPFNDLAVLPLVVAQRFCQESAKSSSSSSSSSSARERVDSGTAETVIMPRANSMNGSTDGGSGVARSPTKKQGRWQDDEHRHRLLLMSKLPRWNDDVDSFCMSFHGHRIKCASSKNFVFSSNQLESDGKKGKK